MTDLSDRQINILKTVVEEYTKTAEPVGSETLDRKYNLGISPATIRNEMAYLSDLGYLKQPHTSAGRVPTPVAIKLYIAEMMRERNLTVAEEVSAKEKIWDKPIVTEITKFKKFYPAEDYHQEYYENNPNQGYCAYVITPKVEKFERIFKDKLKK